MSSITVRPLSEALISPAYALVRFDQPSITHEEWRVQALDRLADQAGATGGVLIAIDPAGRILALLEYRRSEGKPRHFRVERMITPGITQQQAVWLEARLKEAAQERGVRLLPRT